MASKSAAYAGSNGQLTKTDSSYRGRGGMRAVWLDYRFEVPPAERSAPATRRPFVGPVVRAFGTAMTECSRSTEDMTFFAAAPPPVMTLEAFLAATLRTAAVSRSRLTDGVPTDGLMVRNGRAAALAMESTSE